MFVPLLVLSIVGLLVNTFVIVVIVGSSLRHSVFMTVLIVLAVADNLTLLSTDFLQRGVFGHILGQDVLAFRGLMFIVQCTVE